VWDVAYLENKRNSRKGLARKPEGREKNLRDLRLDRRVTNCILMHIALGC